MIILGVDWWEGETAGRRRRKSKSWVCYSMNMLFKWMVPTDRRKSVSGWEQGKKVRKGFGRWLRVCCLSRDKDTTWTPSRSHRFLSPHPMPPHFTGHVNLEMSPNLASNPKGLAKKWRNKTQDESLHSICKMGISELRFLAQLMEN